MTALDQFRQVITAVIHDGVVEATKAGAGITGGVDNAAGVEHVDDDVGTVLRSPLGLGRREDLTGCRHADSPL
jgi:hypothetical protein